MCVLCSPVRWRGIHLQPRRSWTMTQMLPRERLNLNSNWAIHVSLLPLLHQYPEQDQQTWNVDKFFLHSSYSLEHYQTPRATYAHVILPTHYHHTQSPGHDEFQQGKILPIKNEEKHASFLHSSTTITISKPLLLSFHVVWDSDCYCYLVFKSCTNWIRACQLNA